jgi:hypothetical protein
VVVRTEINVFVVVILYALKSYTHV